MHYSDQEQLDENILKLAIYIHEEDDSNELTVQVASIHECKYFNPRTLQKILMVPEHFINPTGLETESWLLVSIKDMGYDTTQILSIEDVSESDTEFYRLH